MAAPARLCKDFELSAKHIDIVGLRRFQKLVTLFGQFVGRRLEFRAL